MLKEVAGKRLVSQRDLVTHLRGSSSSEIKDLHVGWLEERVALFAGDLLLFMNDAGLSFQGALQLLNSYSLVMGHKINWTKSL